MRSMENIDLYDPMWREKVRAIKEQQIMDTYKEILKSNKSFIPHKFIAPKIKNVIFNKPYTIVFWTDGTKTTVTCGKNDVWDEEKGVALAFVKKLYGNKSSYIENIKPFLTENVEKVKAKEAQKRQKFEAEIKADDERRRQRHIKNLAMKRLRQERLEREVKEAMKSLKKDDYKSLADAFKKSSQSVAQCAKSFNDTVDIVTSNYKSGDIHIHCDTKDGDVVDKIIKAVGEVDKTMSIANGNG